jgi:hypothetical protein
MRFDRRIVNAEKTLNTRKEPEPEDPRNALIGRANRGDESAIKEVLTGLSDSELEKLYLDSGGDPTWWIESQTFKGDFLQ